MEDNNKTINLISSSEDEDDKEKENQIIIYSSPKRKRDSSSSIKLTEELPVLKKIKNDLEEGNETNMNPKIESLKLSNSFDVLKTLSDKSESNICDTSQVDKSLPQMIVKKTLPVLITPQEDFNKFLDLCSKIDSSEQMKNLIEKLKQIYMTVDKNYLKSESFINLLKKYHKLIEKKIFVHKSVREIIYELKIRRSKPENENFIESNQEKLQDIKLPNSNLKNLEKLEFCMLKIKEKIESYESEVVDWEKEEDSNYMKLDRYKKKYLELYNKYCQLRNEKELIIKYLKVKDFKSNEMSNIEIIDESIIKFINLKIKKFNKARINKPASIGNLSYVPDYTDVLQCINKCNIEHDLKLPKYQKEEFALRIFKTVVTFLQRQREYDNWYSYTSYLEDAPKDPAEINKELTKKLDENKQETEKKLNEVFENYVKKQNTSLEDFDNQKEAENEDENEDESDSDVESSTEQELVASDADDL